MLKVGIVGIGNLGKALSQRLQHCTDFELVAKFSRRNIKDCISFEQIFEYQDKIDLLFLCGGSQNELESHAKNLISHFNIVESYDNHSRLESHIGNINSMAIKHKKIAICSAGWDPGLFSLMRGLFDSLGFVPYSFWGKGLSQGHTQAIKQITGVEDALQFTIPNQEALQKIIDGHDVESGAHLHKRECYVVAKSELHKDIENAIKSMPHYFADYQTTVQFVSQEDLNKLKDFSHKGQVLTQNNEINFSLNLPSNPDFTASVMSTFARAIARLKEERKYGAYTIFDLPFEYILTKNKYQFL